MRIYFDSDFKNALIGSEVIYKEFTPEVGKVYNTLPWVDIAEASLPPVCFLLGAWLKSRSNRKLIITKKDKTIIHIEGGSVAENEKLAKVAKSIYLVNDKK